MFKFRVFVLSFGAMISSLAVSALPIDRVGDDDNNITVAEVVEIGSATYFDHIDGEIGEVSKPASNPKDIPFVLHADTITTASRYFRIDLIVTGKDLYRSKPAIGIWFDGKIYEFDFVRWFILTSDPRPLPFGKTSFAVSLYVHVNRDNEPWFKPFLHFTETNTRVWDSHHPGLVNYQLTSFDRWSDGDLRDCRSLVTVFVARKK